MKYILIGLVFSTQILLAQKVTKADKVVMANLKKTITFLADDKLEGRRTGSAGEKLAYEFIQKEFIKAGLQTFTANNSYIQNFDVSGGKEIANENTLVIGDMMFALEKEDFSFPFSASATELDLKSIKNSVAIIDIANTLIENKNNPHFDINDKIYTLAKNAQAEKKQAVIFINTSSIKDNLAFDAKDKSEKLQIPVIYLTQKIAEQLGDLNYRTTLSVLVKDTKKTGHNVIGYINNKASSTIILGAHYDHLGYGEDHNSLYTGSAPMIHNGADDNASGTAALIEMAKFLQKSTYKKYNFLFVSFSGEELGLFGSKYFADNAGLDLKTVNYMVNMDMVGRLNDSTHGITIGGYGTSPTWGKIIKKEDIFFKLNLDSSGSGPSDHTSFYKKDIPVLFFFTGSHKDYHKPTDDADKINYAGELQIIKYIQNIIAQTDKMDKLAFTKTREVSMGKSSFKVSVGIMPDYTFTGNGVRVDGVSENKPAQKAGVKTGDVLMQLGDYKFSDVQSYMGVLNKFEKGQSTNLKLMRGKDELSFPITF
jgi:aminopeptidase YwaD